MKLTLITTTTLTAFFLTLALAPGNTAAGKLANSTVNKNKTAKQIFFDAVTSGDVKKVEELIKNGAKLDLKDTLGRTALDHALMQKNKNMVQKLISSGAKIDELSLHTAALKGNSEILRLLLEQESAQKYIYSLVDDLSLLYYAAFSDDLDTVKLVYDKSVNNTNAHKVSAFKKTALKTANDMPSGEIKEFLIAQAKPEDGVKINFYNNKNYGTFN